MHAFYLFIFFLTLFKANVCDEWCYESQLSCDDFCIGPKEWAEVAKECAGKSQSPINIVTKKVTFNNGLKPIEFHSYQEMMRTTITNNGHSVKVTLSGTAVIKGGDLGTTYKAIELHFHWGKHGSPGSEHTIDGEQYPMEMHIVHIKKMYKTLEEAVKDPSGVAVLGFLYEESGSSDKRYDAILNTLTHVTRPGKNSTLMNVSLDMLIPPHNQLTNYYRYNGSLTTPNCTESVVWTVFPSTIKLSKKQLSAFSNLQFANGNKMVGTFRPVQPLNKRVVYYSGSNIASVSTILLISTVLTTFFIMLE